jgi:hypothetical protein
LFGSHVYIDCAAVAVENTFSLFGSDIFYAHTGIMKFP